MATACDGREAGIGGDIDHDDRQMVRAAIGGTVGAPSSRGLGIRLSKAQMLLAILALTQVDSASGGPVAGWLFWGAARICYANCLAMPAAFTVATGGTGAAAAGAAAQTCWAMCTLIDASAFAATALPTP